MAEDIIYEPIEVNSLITKILSSEGGEAFKQFAEIPIYGTTKQPLFPVTRLEDLLGMTSMRTTLMRWRKEDDHEKYVKKIRAKGFHVPINVLTKRGIIKALMRGNTELCKVFAEFVFILIEDLEEYGQVSEEKELAKLRDVTKEEAKLNEIIQLQKDKIDDLKREKLNNEIHLTDKINEQSEDIVELKDRLDGCCVEDVDGRYIAQVEERFMKPLYVYDMGDEIYSLSPKKKNLTMCGKLHCCPKQYAFIKEDLKEFRVKGGYQISFEELVDIVRGTFAKYCESSPKKVKKRIKINNSESE